MSAKDRFESLERKAEVLKKIANQYGQDSAEALTIKEATFALLFALTERAEEFAKYVEQANSSLTAEQRANLARFGLRN